MVGYPFGLANVFKFFQNNINWGFRDFYDEFYSVHVDDILIYTHGSRTEDQKQVLRKAFARRRFAIKRQ